MVDLGWLRGDALHVDDRLRAPFVVLWYYSLKTRTSPPHSKSESIQGADDNPSVFSDLLGIMKFDLAIGLMIFNTTKRTVNIRRRYLYVYVRGDLLRLRKLDSLGEIKHLVSFRCAAVSWLILGLRESSCF